MSESNSACKKWPHFEYAQIRIPAVVVPIAVSTAFTVWKLFYASNPSQNRHLGSNTEGNHRQKDDEEVLRSKTAARASAERNVWLDRIDKLCLFGFHGQISLRYTWTPNALAEEIWWLGPAEIFVVLLAGIYHENNIRGSLESWTLALAWMLPLAQQLEIVERVPYWLFVLLALPTALPKPLAKAENGAWGHYFFSVGCMLTYAFNGIISEDSPWREYRIGDMELWPNMILAGLAILQPIWRWTCALLASDADRNNASRMGYISADATNLIGELARCLRGIAPAATAFMATSFAGGSCIGWRYLLLDLPANPPSLTEGFIAGVLMCWVFLGLYALRRRKVTKEDMERLCIDSSGYTVTALLFLALVLWASRRLASGETSLQCFDKG